MVLGIIYSGYALYVNITEPSSVLSFSNLPLKISYASILLHFSGDDSLTTALLIEGWLLVGVVFVWMICLFVINWSEIRNKRMVDNSTITAADFSVMIENVPY